jgi:GPH family glycoside/pentoside/hexuronide:cation symporter
VPAPGVAAPRKRLSVATKIVYGLGDHTVNLVLSSASLLYLAFLTEVAGLRPALAGLVILIARWVDAITDPLMGRLSDLTRWRLGRRRGYFLIGAAPFGVSFALMWASPPLASEAARVAYYALVYVFVSCAMTCLSVPYLALLPEMATGYDERTSLNTYRSMAAVLGTLVAASMKAVTDWLGGDAAAWQQAAQIFAVWIALPWLLVFAVSFERPSFSRPVQAGFLQGARQLVRHRTYRTLVAFFILARIAVDMIAAMFLLYFRHWIGREEDFTTTLFLFLSVVVLAQPLWLFIARRTDKRTAFIAGALWWIGFEIVIYLVEPGWPRASLYAITALAAIGYAVADLMPWSMLGEVIDEDELASGERREGIYVGFFTFLRKLGGSLAVALVAVALDLCGFVGGLPREEQAPLALDAIRVLTSLVPAGLLLLAVLVARGYPLDRAAHTRILDEIERRAAATAG